MPVPVVFMGTPTAAVTVLDALVEAGHEVPLVVSRPDRRRGRGGTVSPSPVKERALALGLDVTDELDEVARRSFAPGTVAVVVAYGRIIPRRILELMPMLNVHFSLLPRWRGAAPVERAILAGDRVTGVCIMSMEEGLDTGPVHASETVATDDLTAAELTARLASVGSRLVCRILESPLGTPQPQEGTVTLAPKITAGDLVIDWSRSAEDIVRQVRAVDARTRLEGRTVRIVSARTVEGQGEPGILSVDATVGTGRGLVGLVRVRPESRPEMDAADWLRGVKSTFPLRLG